MKLKTMLGILNSLEGAIDFPDDEGLQELIGQFNTVFNWRYRNVLMAMQEKREYCWPEHLLKQDISKRLREEFKPIYLVYQERLRYRRE